MDPGSLVLILATSLTLPPGPDVQTAHARKPGEVRRLALAKVWLHQHWGQQLKALEESQSCLEQAQSLGDVGLCARLSQQRARLNEALQVAASCAAPPDGLASLDTAVQP